MNKEELFKKYSINDSHNEWEPIIDNWNGVEIYKTIKGNLPNSNDEDILEFIDQCEEDYSFTRKFTNFGSMYLTAKRSVYRYSDEITMQLRTKT